jgi:hypothetical protein
LSGVFVPFFSCSRFTEETGVVLNWVSLEEGVLREQVRPTPPPVAASTTSAYGKRQSHRCGGSNH